MAGQTEFEAALSALKRRGSAPLVVGTVPPEAYRRASRRMLGDPAAGPRRRLLVVPESARESAVERLRATGRTDPSHAQVLTCNGTTRGVTAATSGDDGPPVRHVEGSLREVGSAVTAAIERFDAAAAGLDPGELRVGVDPLGALDGYDTRAAFGFLHVLTKQVRRSSGMGHVRLARDPDASAVRTLAPLFDATVELRVDGYRLEQRWHLHDEGIVSDWLPVDDET